MALHIQDKPWPILVLERKKKQTEYEISLFHVKFREVRAPSSLFHTMHRRGRFMQIKSTTGAEMSVSIPSCI